MQLAARAAIRASNLQPRATANSGRVLRTHPPYLQPLSRCLLFVARHRCVRLQQQRRLLLHQGNDVQPFRALGHLHVKQALRDAAWGGSGGRGAGWQGGQSGVPCTHSQGLRAGQPAAAMQTCSCTALCDPKVLQSTWQPQKEAAQLSTEKLHTQTEPRGAALPHLRKSALSRRGSRTSIHTTSTLPPPSSCCSARMRREAAATCARSRRRVGGEQSEAAGAAA